MTHHVIGTGLRRLEASHRKEAPKPHCITHTGLEHLNSSIQTEIQRVPWSVGAHDSQSGPGGWPFAMEEPEMEVVLSWPTRYTEQNSRPNQSKDGLTPCTAALDVQVHSHICTHRSAMGEDGNVSALTASDLLGD